MHHLRQERVAQLLQDLPFRHGIFDLLSVDDLLLLERLHGVEFAILPLPHQENFPERPLPEDGDDLEVLTAEPVLSGVQQFGAF